MITFDNVNFKYKDSDSGLFNIDMEIKDGEFVLLAGESGCGKTTITRLINGLIPAFYEGELSGALRLDGTDISSMTITQISRLVGSVFQDPSTQFFTTDTTSEIAFPCENAGMNWEQIVQKVETAVNYLSIEHLLGKSIFNLSSGEKQSVAIASVFTLSPSIYVFDEPSANLDTESTLKLQSILKTLKDAGNTIIISEHKLYYLWELVDKVVFMQKGHIERIFSGEEYRGLSNLDAHHMGLRCTQMEMVPFVHANFSKNQEIVKADNVSFSYGKNRTVLNRVSFHAQQGQITGIIGHNGVGVDVWNKETKRRQFYLSGKSA